MPHSCCMTITVSDSKDLYSCPTFMVFKEMQIKMR